MCFVVTCWERADILALVCGVYCEFVTFPLVSWVRCGTLLYRFLIFAPLLTLFVSYFNYWNKKIKYEANSEKTDNRVHKEPSICISTDYKCMSEFTLCAMLPDFTL